MAAIVERGRFPGLPAGTVGSAPRPSGPVRPPASKPPPDAFFGDVTPAAPTTATTSDTGGGPPEPTAGAVIDWTLYFDYLGLPGDVAGEVARIFRTTSDVNQSIALAMAYIRGTQWYAATFPGIEAGKRLGLIQDERGYRAYMNQVNQAYRRYFDRDVTLQEFSQTLVEGVTPDIVEKRLAADAFIQANRPDLQYAAGAFGGGQLNEAQLRAYGRQQSGLESTVGFDLNRRIQLAMQRLQRVFEGSLATPGLSLGPAGVQAPTLGRTSGTLDIGR